MMWFTIVRLFTVVCLVSLLSLLWSPVAQAASQDVTAAWTAPTVNPSSVTGYIIEGKTGTAGTFAQVGTTNATTLTFTEVNVPQGIVRCYRELATSAVGNSPPSPEGCGATAGTPGAPGAPTITITIR